MPPSGRQPPVLVAIGDTHGTAGHRLERAALSAVREAEVVVHTGDFTTTAVLDAFETETRTLAAVAGNNDDGRVREQLPETRTVDALGHRFVVAHGHQHDDTSLSLLARDVGADVVLVGHSHRPAIRTLGDVSLVNPGSHADPRWYEPGFAAIERTGIGLEVRLRTPAGEAIEVETL